MIEEPCALPEAYGGTARSSYETLEGEFECAVAVIGGGITGASAALHLAQAGHQVTLLEGKEVGWGGSGRAYGLIVAYAKHDHEVIRARFGAERGERLISVLAEGPDYLFDLIERHGIDCEAVRSGWIFGAHTPAAAPALQARANFWADRGAPVSFHTADEAAELTGSPRYHGAMQDKRSGGLNPLAYTRGLARAARGAGTAIFEHSPVVRIEPGRQARWRLTTPNGQIEADQVVHCTNAYTTGLWPGLARTVIPLRAYQLVTKPLTDNVLKRLLPGGHIVTDTRHLFSGIRKLPDGRVHLSADGPVLTANRQPRLAEAAARLTTTFPHVGKVEWDEIWTAWVGVSTDQFPKLFRLGEGMWAVLGYSGRGLAFGTLMGREIEKLITEPKRDDLILPLEPMKPIPLRKLAPLGAAALVTWYRVTDRTV